MPPLPVAPGVAKVRFVQSSSGRSFGDSLFFFHTDLSSWTAPELLALATNAGLAYDATILGAQSTSLLHVSTDATDLSDLVGRFASFPSGVGGAAGATPMLPLNAVAHVALEVGRRYRGGRPGYNVSGLVQGDLADEKSFSAGSAVAIAGFIHTLATTTVGGGGMGAAVEHVGVSYHAGGAVRVAPLVEVIVDYECQQRICTLRKRLGKGITG